MTTPHQTERRSAGLTRLGLSAPSHGLTVVHWICRTSWKADVVPSSLPPDLRSHLPADVLDRVERDLGTRLDRDSLVRKRRSVGATTDRATWVRIEVRTIEKVGGQGFDGLQAAGSLTGVTKPA